MDKRILLILIGCLVPLMGWAGPGHGGGGDSCEERFKDIKQDLKKWILAGGHKGLDLEKGSPPIKSDDYSAKMIDMINQARITCVDKGDPGFPVMINGHPKECINFVDDNGVPRIICDLNKFYSGLMDKENDAGQYRIVHHEYASLAGFEIPNEEDSDYRISDRITGFLENKIVLRLAIKSPQVTETSFVKIGNSTYKKVSYGMYDQVIGVPENKDIVVCRINGSTRVHVFEAPNFSLKFEREKELSRLQLGLENAYWDLGSRLTPRGSDMRAVARTLRNLPNEIKFECQRSVSAKQLKKQTLLVLHEIQRTMKVYESFKATPNYDIEVLEPSEGDFCTPMKAERLNPYLYGLNFGLFETEESPYCRQNVP